MAEDPPAQAPTTSVNVHQDPLLWLILIDFITISLPELDKSIQAGNLNWSVAAHIVIQAIISVIRLRSSDVVTGLKVFDK